MSKIKKIVIIAISILIVAIVLTLSVCFVIGVLPVGLNNRDTVTVSCFLKENSDVVIPIKMKRGVYSPSYNAFKSELTVKELCDLAKTYENQTEFTYEIVGDNAIIYSNVTNAIQAQILSISWNSKKFDYALTNGHVTVDGVALFLPIYLFDNYDLNNRQLNNIKFQDNVNLEKIIDFYSVNEHFNVERVNDFEVNVKGISELCNFNLNIKFNQVNKTLDIKVTD